MYYRLCWNLSVVDDGDGCIIISKLMCFIFWLLSCACVDDIPIRFVSECFISEIIIEISELPHRERDVFADVARYAIGFDEDLILFIFFGIFRQGRKIYDPTSFCISFINKFYISFIFQDFHGFRKKFAVKNARLSYDYVKGCSKPPT
jgi:hypothetical protein